MFGLQVCCPLVKRLTREKDAPLTGGDWLSLSGSENWLLKATNFSLTKEATMSAERFLSGGGGGGLINVLKVENNFQVSVVLLNLSL